MEIFGARNRIVKSQVWLGGLAAYVESNGEEQISAAVELTHFKAQATAVPLLVTDGASRLFSTLRTEPRYVEPFMTLLEERIGATGQRDDHSYHTESQVRANLHTVSG